MINRQLIEKKMKTFQLKLSTPVVTEVDKVDLLHSISLLGDGIVYYNEECDKRQKWKRAIERKESNIEEGGVERSEIWMRWTLKRVINLKISKNKGENPPWFLLNSDQSNQGTTPRITTFNPLYTP